MDSWTLFVYHFSFYLHCIDFRCEYKQLPRHFFNIIQQDLGDQITGKTIQQIVCSECQQELVIYRILLV